MNILDGKIQIDLIDLLRSLEGESKNQLVKYLACEDEVIDRVAQQISFGITDDLYSGSLGQYTTPNTALTKARLLVSENSSELSKTVIQQLQYENKSLQKRLDDAYAELHKKREFY